MKRILYVILFLAGVCTSVEAQVSIGPKLFLNLSNAVGGDNGTVNKFKLGYSAGAFLKIDINDQIFFEPEALYSVRGFKYSSTFGNRDTSLRHRMSYIDFPFLIGMNVGGKGFLNVGPQIGYLVNDRSKGVISNSSSSRNIDTSNVYGYSTTEYAIAFGGGYNFPYHLKVALRGIYGLTQLFTKTKGTHNLAFGIAVSYSFGDDEKGKGGGMVYRKL